MICSHGGNEFQSLELFVLLLMRSTRLWTIGVQFKGVAKMYHEWHARELSCFGNVGTLHNMAMNPNHLGWLEAHKQKAYGQIQGQY
jgi:hypothetical protein